MPRRRRTAADEIAALGRGGIDALQAAERLASSLRSSSNLNIRIAPARLAAYRAAAETAGQSLTDWVTTHLDAAARRAR